MFPWLGPRWHAVGLGYLFVPQLVSELAEDEEVGCQVCHPHAC